MAKTGQKETERRRNDGEGLAGRDPVTGRGRGMDEDEWGGGGDADLDEQEGRIVAVVGPGDGDPEEALRRFHAHLLKQVKLPCVLTGQEEFGWEEPYTSGEGSKREYRELRETQPSYTDEFELVELVDGAENEWSVGGAWDRSIVARAVRSSDGRPFDLPLAELRVIGGRARNHTLVEDYSYWFATSYASKIED